MSAGCDLRAMTLYQLTETVLKLRDQVASLQANQMTHERILGQVGAYAACPDDDVEGEE